MINQFTPDAIINEARSWIGTPYHHQARIKHVGCDCLGLIIGIWENISQNKIYINCHYAPDWAECADNEYFALKLSGYAQQINLHERQSGDVLLFRWRPSAIAKHAAILASEERIIHAHERAGVHEISLSPWWQSRLAYVFRFHHL